MASQPTQKTIEESSKEQLLVWKYIVNEAIEASAAQPVMESFFHSNILTHNSFQEAISFYLSSRFACDTVPAMTVKAVFDQAMDNEPAIIGHMLDDLMAHYTRDAACDQYLMPFLYFKGFHAVQLHRISHWLWEQGRYMMALYFQHRISELFAVDIHPAAQIGSGLMMDHATGVVIGETAVVGNDVSMLHGVTLGGSGAQAGDRHPHVGDGVLLSAGAKLLGNITIGDGVKVGAGSLVLHDVPPHFTVAGVPARQVGQAHINLPSLAMDHSLDN